MRLSTTAFIFTSIISATYAFLPPTNKIGNNAASFIATGKSSTQRFVLSSASAVGKPGTAELGLPWEELGFEFRPTKSNLRIVYKNGEWGEMQLCEVCTLLLDQYY